MQPSQASFNKKAKKPPTLQLDSLSKAPQRKESNVCSDRVNNSQSMVEPRERPDNQSEFKSANSDQNKDATQPQGLSSSTKQVNFQVVSHRRNVGRNANGTQKSRNRSREQDKSLQASLADLGQAESVKAKESKVVGSDE